MRDQIPLIHVDDFFERLNGFSLIQSLYHGISLLLP